MNHVARSIVLLCLYAGTAHAQTASHWGVAGGFIPKWDTSGAAEDFNKLLLNEDYPSLSGSEFRIGLIRGRRLSGDWGVSFVRRMVDDPGTLSITDGFGCQGGNSLGGPVILTCEGDSSELTPNDLLITGIEVNKFFAFATISERVQIGLNIAGGIGVGKGTFDTRTFHTKYTCTFPIGVFPNYSFDTDPCTGGVKSNQTTSQTGASSEPFTRLLAYDKNRIPLGKVEVAVAVIVAPQLKVRLSGGLNYPGMSTIGVTGLYFFGSD